MFVLIADSHVTPGAPQEATFFTMLDRIAQTDYDVIFLGDNLDIWIAAAPKYENDLHRRFLDWCKREKARRRVVFVEGNHEFYVCRHHADCFSDCVETVFRLPGISFIHGDAAHPAFSFHRFFRAFAKNWFGDTVMSIMPGGLHFAMLMKRLLAHGALRKNVPCDYIPYDAVDRWSTAENAASGAKIVFMGHFHCGGHHELEHVRYVILKAWIYTETVALLDENTMDFTIDAWENILHA